MAEWIWRALISLALFSLSLQVYEVKETLKEIGTVSEYRVEAKYVLVNPCDLWDVAMKNQVEASLK